MPAKVFISCGQATPEEKLVANTLADWFASVGYEPYVAITVQTIMDLNSGIIGALKTSDYYVLINFRREEISSKPRLYRGSLYTHQELAAAYVLGFQNMIFGSQRDVKQEGMLKFIVSNAPVFDTADEVPAVVRSAVSQADWSPEFSRQLSVATLRWGPSVSYMDHTTPHNAPRACKVLHADIRNNRADIAARHAICRLRDILSASALLPSSDQSVLKASGFLGYEHTIWPSSVGSFDLLAVSFESPKAIYLHSAMDRYPRNPVINVLGSYKLTYDVLAEDFPPLSFDVDLHVTGDFNSTSANIAV
jgi:hypothetical protein